jgi:phosphonate transport system ATP-binding protein
VATLVELRKASAGYAGCSVLHDINLTIQTGERTAVMGRSGAGKSTLLNLLYQRLADRVALIPQTAALVKNLPVFHNVYMGRLDRRPTWYNLRTLVWPARRDVAEIEGELERVGLADKLFAKAGTLSGGQQQRTSVARALDNGRPILIGDEPVSALDRVQGSDVLALLRSQRETLVLALHDVHHALEHADRIVVLQHGREIIDEPSSILTANNLLRHFRGEP